MSSRRQARAGTLVADARREGLPPALASRHDPLWADPEAVVDLAAACRLDLRPDQWRTVAAAPWWARFDAFRDAWCRANGLVHPQWAPRLDFTRAREAGIDMSSSSRYRLRILEAGRQVGQDHP